MKHRTILAMSIVLFASSHAHAVLVTHSFTGTITDIRAGGQFGTPISGLGGVDVGDSFSGMFAYDTDDAGPDLASRTDMGLYSFPANTTTLFVDIDGTVFDTGLYVEVDNDYPEGSASPLDIFSAARNAPDLPAGWSVSLPSTSRLDVFYVDTTASVLSSDALPTSFNPVDWEVGLLRVRFADGVTTPTGFYDDDIFIEGTISMVPEPSSLILASIALLLGVIWSTRRRNVAK